MGILPGTTLAHLKRTTFAKLCGSNSLARSPLLGESADSSHPSLLNMNVAVEHLSITVAGVGPSLAMLGRVQLWCSDLRQVAHRSRLMR